MTTASDYAKVFRGAAKGIYNKITKNGTCFKITMAGSEPELSHAETMMAAFNGIAEVFEIMAQDEECSPNKSDIEK